eukprot:CAMPEP_0175990364 /NCGR_PEP_ID=MMETSP0108-20121206/52266_1 /TAXON_ID=195067 ORGANISM="Goniomonas pacifica, Strain CCMP1869" /NCGR_SAMPLE_ID=MMETSP0108 /ASSEMBLY_ACC=CAM_ASM_000204 /LENGTH=98 /DNA_ID=CAMNT_0017321829 /DNA_START=434 /DNA_END=727 /DNA_ORIENTATION=-
MVLGVASRRSSFQSEAGSPNSVAACANALIKTGGGLSMLSRFVYNHLVEPADAIFRPHQHRQQGFKVRLNVPPGILDLLNHLRIHRRCFFADEVFHLL